MWPRIHLSLSTLTSVRAAVVTDRAISSLTGRTVAPECIRRFSDGGHESNSQGHQQQIKFQQQLNDLEQQFQRHSRLVMELQSDIMSYMRSELSQLRGAGVSKQSIPYSSTCHINGSVGVEPHSAVHLNSGEHHAPKLQNGQLDTRLDDLEAKVLHLERMANSNSRQASPKMDDSGKLNVLVGVDVLDRLNMLLETLIKELSQEHLTKGGANAALLTQLKAMELKIHAQEAQIANMAGMPDVVRVGGLAVPRTMFIPPYSYTMPHLPLYLAAHLWSLPTILAEVVGFSESSMEVNPSVRDVLLDRIISIGAPGALWHASNEVVDDQPLWNESMLEALASFAQSGAFLSLEEPVQGQLTTSAPDIVSVVDGRHVGDSGKRRDVQWKSKLASSDVEEIVVELDSPEHTIDPSINSSQSEVDKGNGAVARPPPSPLGASQDHKCPVLEKQEERMEGPLHEISMSGSREAYDTACKEPPASLGTNSTGTEKSMQSLERKHPVELVGDWRDKGENKQQSHIYSNLDTAKIEASYVQELTNSSANTRTWVGLIGPNKPSQPFVMCGQDAHSPGVGVPVESEQPLFPVTQTDDDMVLSLLETIEDAGQKQVQESDPTPPEQAVSCSLPAADTSNRPAKPRRALQRFDSWPFPTVAVSINHRGLPAQEEQNSFVLKSFEVHGRSVQPINQGTPKENCPEANEEALEGLNDANRSLGRRRSCSVLCGIEGNMVENPLYGKKWAMTKCDPGVKDSATSRINPLYGEDIAEEIDSQKPHKGHTRSLTRMISINDCAAGTSPRMLSLKGK